MFALYIFFINSYTELKLFIRCVREHFVIHECRILCAELNYLMVFLITGISFAAMLCIYSNYELL